MTQEALIILSILTGVVGPGFYFVGRLSNRVERNENDIKETKAAQDKLDDRLERLHIEVREGFAQLRRAVNGEGS